MQSFEPGHQRRAADPHPPVVVLTDDSEWRWFGSSSAVAEGVERKARTRRYTERIW